MRYRFAFAPLVPTSGAGAVGLRDASPVVGDVDCSDFGSSAEARPYLLPGDPRRLDADGDGQARDGLP